MTDTVALTRSAVDTLIRDAERRTGSRMAAYENVARSIGTTAGWLRKFTAGQEAKEPGWITGWNILDQYRRYCNRVEAEIETERTTRLALMRNIDALTETLNYALDRTSKDASRGEASTDAD